MYGKEDKVRSKWCSPFTELELVVCLIGGDHGNNIPGPPNFALPLSPQPAKDAPLAQPSLTSPHHRKSFTSPPAFPYLASLHNIPPCPSPPQPSLTSSMLLTWTSAGGECARTSSSSVPRPMLCRPAKCQSMGMASRENTLVHSTIWRVPIPNAYLASACRWAGGGAPHGHMHTHQLSNLLRGGGAHSLALVVMVGQVLLVLASYAPVPSDWFSAAYVHGTSVLVRGSGLSNRVFLFKCKGAGALACMNACACM